MDTGRLQKSISRVFPNKTSAIVAELFLLFFLGVIAVVIHSKLRIPMHLPGKQGLIFIALVVAGKGLSRFPYAASLICAGSTSLILTNLFGFSDPFMAVNFILLGGIMDIMFKLSEGIHNRIFSGAIAGASWMAVPLFKLITSSLFLLPMNSFSTGIAYPFITYFLFGLAGGLLGSGLLSLFVGKESR
ncbi:MAG TPA: hypothetical protein VK212_11070 [Lentimicrobium sp.]|nr:hypothetical protein [Lentimicrobium sp.]